MTTIIPLSSCPVCGQTPFVHTGKNYRCENCGLGLTQQSILGFKLKDQYRVDGLGDAYRLAAAGIVGRTFERAALANFGESVYTDATLEAIARGDFEAINLPASTVSQVLLEQMRETCFVQVSNLRRAHGPTLTPGGSRFPEGVASTVDLTIKGEGTLYLTDKRIIFTSSKFTYLRLDGKLTGLKTFENGVAVQRRDEDFATWFVGCGAHQAALIAAYIQGRVPSLRAEATTQA